MSTNYTAADLTTLLAGLPQLNLDDEVIVMFKDAQTNADHMVLVDCALIQPLDFRGVVSEVEAYLMSLGVQTFTEFLFSVSRGALGGDDEDEEDASLDDEEDETGDDDDEGPIDSDVALIQDQSRGGYDPFATTAFPEPDSDDGDVDDKVFD